MAKVIKSSGLMICTILTPHARMAVISLSADNLPKTSTTATMIDRMVPFAEFNKLMGLDRIREIESNYATGR